MGRLLSYQKWLVVRVALLMLFMGILIHGAIYLYEHKVVIPQLYEGEQTKADLLLQAYLPVLSAAVQSGNDQQIQLLVSQMQLMTNPVTGSPLLVGVEIESVDGTRWADASVEEGMPPFTSESILFSAGEIREMVGFAKLYYSREFFDYLSRNALESLYQLSLLMTLLSVFVLAVLARYLRPLHTLAHALQQWDVGSSPSQLPEPTRSASQEIVLVHGAISRLLDDLHSYQVSLEDLVNERTERLQRANEKLERAHQRITEQNNAFSSLARIDSVNVPLHASMESITRTAALTLGVERVSIWLYRSDKRELHCINLYQRSGNQHSGGEVLVVEEYPTYFEALEQERALVVHWVERDRRVQEFRNGYLQSADIRSMLDAPIRIGSQTIGVVCNEACGEHHQWSVDEENFAISVADFVALALESDQRLQVEEDLRKHRDHLEELVEDRTTELRVANQKLQEEMALREKLEKAEQYNAFQSGVAEMSAVILHNIGNVVTGMQASIEKGSRYANSFTKISQTIRLMQQRHQTGELDQESLHKGMGLLADSVDRLGGESGVQGQLDKLRQGVFHVGEVISVYQSASKMEVSAARFNLQTMLKDCLHLIQDKFDKYQIDHETLCPADLEITIPRNPAMQALLNLMKNSVEAILERREEEPGHGGRVIVRVEARADEKILLEVKDDGCGIAEGDDKRIFNHGFTSKSYGSGYGLHSAANFVSSIGGTIEAHSAGRNQGGIDALAAAAG